MSTTSRILPRDHRAALPFRRLAVVAAMFTVGIAATMAPPVAAQARERGTAEVDDELAWHLGVLRAVAVDGDVRRGAALRLLRAGRPGADEAIASLVDRGRHEVIVAVVEAMAELDVAPPSLLDLLATRLPEFATDLDEAELTRRAAIRLLGRVPSRESIAALVTIIERAGTAPPFADHSLEFLAERSLLRLGARPSQGQRWTAWWQENRDRPVRDLLSSIVDRLASDAADAMLRAEGLSAELAAVEQRLAAAEIELMLRLPAEARPERLVRMLGDPVAAVRRVALEHVDRNFPAQPLDDRVHAAVTTLLADANTGLRANAIRLLDRIDRPGLDEAIGPPFAAEESEDVIAAYLVILRRLTAPQTETRLVELAGGGERHRERVVDDAARALVTRAEAGRLSADSADRVSRALRPRVAPLIDEAAAAEGLAAVLPGLGTLRLFTIVCDESDFAAMAELLAASSRKAGEAAARGDNGATSVNGIVADRNGGRPGDASAGAMPDPASGDERPRRTAAAILASHPDHRRAIAEGVRLRGDRRTLLALADDDAVFPALMRSFRDGPSTLESVALVAHHLPGRVTAENGSRELDWERTFAHVARDLSPLELLAADDLLVEALGGADAPRTLVARARRRVLERVNGLGTGAVDADVLSELARRAATVELEFGDDAQARRILDNLVPDDPSVETQVLRFRTMALSSEFADARAVSGDDPRWWIDLMTWSIEHGRLDNAAVIFDEIGRQFSAERLGGLEERFVEAYRAGTARFGRATPEAAASEAQAADRPPVQDSGSEVESGDPPTAPPASTDPSAR